MLSPLSKAAESSPAPKKISTPSSSSTRFRRSCAKTPAKSKPPRGKPSALGRTRRHPRRPPDAHHRLRRPKHHRGDGRRRAGSRYEYIALTDHSKAVTVANGLDEKRTLEQIRKIHAAQETIPEFASSPGCEVDILKAAGSISTTKFSRSSTSSSSPCTLI